MNIMNKQFINNLGILSEADFSAMHDSHVVIVGLGGLGGNFSNNIIRLGIHNITLIDFDKFELSNLNRQLFSNQQNIGKYKVDVISAELKTINPNCNIRTINNRIENINLKDLNHIDYIVDAVDKPKTKIFLSKLCNNLNIPLLHGACAGWYGQVGWITPGCSLLEETYKGEVSGLETSLLNPSFTPSAVAAIMTSEFTKYIQGSKETTINELLLIDLYNNKMIKTGKNYG